MKRYSVQEVNHVQVGMRYISQFWRGRIKIFYEGIS